MIRILLVDDHAVVREGYRRFLERSDDLRVVGEAEDADEGYRLWIQCVPDVTVVDLSMRGPGGLTLLSRIAARSPGAHCLVFSMHEDARVAQRALEAGARGYVTKTSQPEVLVQAVRAVHAGQLYLSADIAQGRAALAEDARRLASLTAEGARDPASARARPHGRRHRTAAEPERQDGGQPPVADPREAGSRHPGCAGSRGAAPGPDQVSTAGLPRVTPDHAGKSSLCARTRDAQAQRCTMHQLRHRFLLPCVWAFAASAAAQDVPRLPEVRVIGTTPLPEGGLSRRQIPAAVQTLDTDPAGSPDARTIADLLDQRLGSVQIQSIQGNPFQPDVNYRGYTASPLLGTPQGLSVYMDGVRLNQPFGDVVSWDLIPAVGDRIDDADAGLESAVRPEHARRRAVDADQGRLQTRPGTAVQLYGRLVRPAGARIRARRRARAAGCTGISPAISSHEDGWRDDSPSDVGSSSASSAGRTRDTRMTR